MNNIIDIIICTHKQFEYIADNSFLPVHVGKEISDLNLPYQADNVGDNISSKNKNYCELTALYWAWKNLKNDKYVGLCHYRRFFYFSGKKIFLNIEEVTEDYFKANFNDYIFKEQLMVDCDIILAEPIILKTSIANDYITSHVREDFDVLRNVVYKLYPDYKNSFIKIMDENNKLSPFNMFITSREITVEYSEWLFSILDEVEKNVFISKYPYQERIFGFMAERLLNVFVYHKKLKVKILPVNFIGSENISTNYFKKGIINLVKNLIFFLSNNKKHNNSK